MKQQVQENYTKEDEEYTRKIFNNECVNCGSRDNLCIDHHRPLSKGFPLSRENAVVLCRLCNSSKGSKLPEEFYTSEQLDVIAEKLNKFSHNF